MKSGWRVVLAGGSRRAASGQARGAVCSLEWELGRFGMGVRQATGACGGDQALDY